LIGKCQYTPVAINQTAAQHMENMKIAITQQKLIITESKNITTVPNTGSNIESEYAATNNSSKCA
jgi:hypothetical protein